MSVTVDSESLSAAVEFYSPFTVSSPRSGGIADVARAEGVYAPECYHDDNTDATLLGAESEWEPLTGHTGQYGYGGACMHASEQLSGALACDVLHTPGTYVLVPVEVFPDDDDEEPEPAGWAVLRRRGEVSS